MPLVRMVMVRQVKGRAKAYCIQQGSSLRKVSRLAGSTRKRASAWGLLVVISGRTVRVLWSLPAGVGKASTAISR